MAPVVNGRVIFNSIPEGFPEPGKTTIYDTTETIDLETAPLEGGFLIKTLELSVDPYMRGRMRPVSVESYVPAFEIGKPIVGFGVGVIIRSENPNYAFEHKNYIIRKDLTGFQILDNPYNLPWSAFIGVLGMPGNTAFMAWREFSRAKKGETVFVSTGAGPVGSFVIQIAKLEGLKVIASAGSEEKVQFMKEIGADAANVGARFIECGMISSYNSKSPVNKLFLVVAKSISMNGFIVSRLAPKWNEEFFKTDISNGLETVGDVLLAVQKGTNKAKAVVHVADE
ncbi:alcohol dehydrogenase [Gymnopilus junonius]|uniref:Alcohol dehydrogenase n=1 Tax=Gymnopilus junonius TaxID=109634 RepID=A0A9P5TL62_GYMJU|nr:alcohol dehydrogenase [Gymnopilus junonius]